jgi:hypothetical protein
MGALDRLDEERALRTADSGHRGRRCQAKLGLFNPTRLVTDYRRPQQLDDLLRVFPGLAI